MVAVTKTVPPARIAAAVAAGVRHLGENRVQEALGHQEALAACAPSARVVWHMIGHLQRNKAKHVAEHFDRLDSLDSLRLARALSRRCAALGVALPVLLEVNVSGEQSKHGFAPEASTLASAAREIAALPGLRIDGLMAIGPLGAPKSELRAAFRRLADLREALRTSMPRVSWAALSMGMSGDYEIAIEEGATEVRLGSTIFGPRHTRPATAAANRS